MRTRRIDAAVVAAFVAAAFLVTGRLWVDPSRRALGANRHDQAFFEFMLAHGARVVTHLEYPFVTHRMNVPGGVNLMANTSILGLSVPLSPVTLALGPHITFTLLLTLAFVATGLAWYYVLSRHVVTSRPAALVGALFCAFAPGMVSHGNGHPNIVAQFLVPFLGLWTLRLAQRPVRNGVILGALVVWQAFINEEILLLTALGLALFLLLRRPRPFRRFLAGLGIAAGVAGPLLAYPLWVQFFGTGAYHGLRGDIRQYGADLGSYPAFPWSDGQLAQNVTEKNAFLGLPLLILVGVLVWLLRKNATAVTLGVVAAAFALASLGPKIKWYGRPLIRGPWALLDGLPLFDSIVPTRFALAVIPPIGVLLALAWSLGVPVRLAYAVALLPLVPLPLAVRPFTPGPELLRHTDGVIVFVPPARSQNPDPLSWAAESGLRWRMAHGYFLGPSAGPGSTAIFTAPARPTAALLNRTAESGAVPPVTAEMRRKAAEDLGYWRADLLVLVPGPHADAVRELTTELLGSEPVFRDGAWVWPR